MKRAVDLILAVGGLALVWPLFALIALLVKLQDGGPVFFRQSRVGRGGKTFRIWKFRTMVPNADKLGMSLTVGQDPRITKIGHWLRKTKLDELPQLLNVVVGEMSFVGPRPEVEQFVDLYTDEQRRVLSLRPGITDPASIHFFRESDWLSQADDPEWTYVHEVMPVKIQLNLEYARRANVLRDILVIVKTVLRMFRGGRVESTGLTQPAVPRPKSIRPAADSKDVHVQAADARD